MNFLLKRIQALNCGWNSAELTADDLYRLCAEHEIEVLEIPLSIGGFYYSVLGNHYIAVDSTLGPKRKLFVLFHEFAHFLFHSPTDSPSASFNGIGRKCRKELEADMFAVCALIPQPMVLTRTPAELIDDLGFPETMVLDRFELFRTLGI